MKSITAVVVLTLTILALVHGKRIKTQAADKISQEILENQKFVFDILQHIYQDDVFVTKFDASYNEYKPWEHQSDFNHVDRLQDFFKLWQQSPFNDDQMWDVMSDDQAKYAVGLLRLLYSAKNWEIFKLVAFWARMNGNKQLFIYTFTIVSMFRDDMKGIVLPAQYETLKPEFLRAFGTNVFNYRMS